MNCGMECVKYLLFIFNFVFALGGLALLALGVILHLGLNNVDYLSTVDAPHVGVPAVLMIIIGAIIFIIAFFGCCGAIRESHCMIITFACLLLTLLVIQVAIAIYGFVVLDKDKVKTTIQDGIKTSVRRYFDESKDKISVDSIQIFSKCCGYDNYNDFLNNPRNTKRIIPYSCCGNEEGKACDISQVYHDPCKDKFWDRVEKYSHALGILAIVIAVIELIGVIFSFCLANSIRNVERRGYKV